MSTIGHTSYGSRMSEWRLIYPPRSWQADALERWLETRRGIVEVVTGGGKTVFAFQAMLSLRKQVADLRTLIIVPSIALADQWAVALQDELSVPAGQIGILGGGERPRPEQPITVAVINSARGRSLDLASLGPTLLVVDECHRVGSEKNATALQGEFVATLGLSATPEREYDAGFAEFIEPALGSIIYRYGYVDAAKDEVITPFNLTNIELPMLETEAAEYGRISKAIANARRSALNDADDDRVKRLLIRRAGLVNRFTYRVPAAVRIIDQYPGTRSIVFHERVGEATQIARLLGERGHSVTLYHAGIDPQVRREHLRRFRAGIYDILVCCRALDEGTNVPETALAVVASGTASRRQRIQRLGRILRPAKGKTHADVYTLFATPEERDRLLGEAQNLAEIASVRWMRMRSEGAHGAAAT
jgi:superfamily II DNA or RNA helicase